MPTFMLINVVFAMLSIAVPSSNFTVIDIAAASIEHVKSTLDFSDELDGVLAEPPAIEEETYYADDFEEFFETNTNTQVTQTPEPTTNTWNISVQNCTEDPYSAQNCVNSSAITYIDFSPYNGPQWVGGHNTGSAGVILSFQVGDIINVSGSSAAGTYRVTGESWVPKANGIDVGSLGQGFAFQTCSGSQMRLVWATRI